MIGKTIGGYRILEEIGRGGMGVVYLAEHEELQKKYALKVLPEELSGSLSSVDRFRNEARVMARLNHPNIVEVMDLGNERDIYYLVMKLVLGPDGKPKDLEDLIDERGGRLSPEQVLPIVLQVCDALRYAHSYRDSDVEHGVVHRDLKPSNVLLDRSGSVKVSDFGLAKIMGSEWLLSKVQETFSKTRTPEPDDEDNEDTLGAQRTVAHRAGRTSSESILGTYDYMSPEQRDPKTAANVDHRIDIYALGVLSYRLLTGRKPVGRFKLPSGIDSSIPAFWDVVTDRCLQPEPGDRYANCDEIIGFLNTQVHQAGTLIEGAKPQRAGEEKKTGVQEHPDREVSRHLRAVPPPGASRDTATVRMPPHRVTPPKTHEEALQSPGSDTRTTVLQRPRKKRISTFWLITAILAVLVGAIIGVYYLVEWGTGGPEGITNSIGMRFVWIEPGEFTMGSPDGGPDNESDENQHEVRLTEGFYMQTAEVTVGQFREFVEDSGYETEAELGLAYSGEEKITYDYTWQNPGFEQNEYHPVVHVTWNDATKFCEWLSKKEGLKYRLPTEAEWEYACRAGTTTSYHWGEEEDDGEGWCNGADLSAQEESPSWTVFQWYDGYVNTSAAVSFYRNDWGLYGMHGNVWEWCQDWYDPNSYYRAEITSDPCNDGQNATGPRGLRVVRGGSWRSFPSDCRSANRHSAAETAAFNHIGFRVVRERGNDSISQSP